MTFNRTLVASALSLAMLSGSAMAYVKNKTYHLTVLHTNDLHGHFWQNEQGEYGLAAQKTVIDNIRKEVAAKGGSVILLNGGDFNTGIPESDLQNARPDIEGMNAIGYEAVTMGNHEFDNPVSQLKQQEKWAKFPFLAANVFDKKTGKTLVKPYTVLEKQGLKVAVVGLTTEDTAKLGNPEYIGDVDFKDPKVIAPKVLKELDKKVKPDVKIALTHMGYYPNAQHGSNAPGDVTLARTLKKGAFDVIVGAHSHDAVCVDEKGVFKTKYTPGEACQPEFQNGTWILQAGEWGKYVGRGDFEFKNGELKLVSYQLIPINLKKKVKNAEGKTEYQLYQAEIPEDAALKAQLKTFQDKGDSLLNTKVGVASGKLVGDRDIVRFHQTNLGRLIATAQMERAQADAGIMNSGGIRDSIKAGDVTYKDILKVHPFGNIISHVTLTGKELQDYLNVVALKEVDSGAYPQFVNFSMVIDFKNKTVTDIKIKGKPIEMDKTYRISLPSYTAAGGDGYPVVTKHPTYVNTGFVDAEMLKAYFEKNGTVNVEQFTPRDEIIYKN